MPPKKTVTPSWLSTSPIKAETEVLFLKLSVFWISIIVITVATDIYKVELHFFKISNGWIHSSFCLDFS